MTTRRTFVPSAPKRTLSLRPNRGKTSSGASRLTRLGFESLEQRFLLANIYWNVDADGFWDVASNWIDETGVSRLPTFEDKVYLDRPTGTYTVTHRSGANAVGSLRADSTNLAVTGGSLGFQGQVVFEDLSLVSSNLTFTGGTLHGYLRTAGNVTWTGGNTHLFDLYNFGTVTLTESAGSCICQIHNSGTINDSKGNGGPASEIGTQIYNSVGGTYNLLADVVPGTTFSNAGTLRKAGGGGTVVHPYFSNVGGTVEVQSGGLILDGTRFGLSPNETWTGGNFHVAAGSSLGISGFNLKLQGAYHGTGDGPVRYFANTLAIDAGGATLDFAGAPLEFAGDRIDTSAAGLTNSGGLRLIGGGSMTIAGVLNNLGTITNALPGNLVLNVGGVDSTVHNLVGGVIDVQSDADFDFGVFNNTGTLRKSAGTGVTTSRFGHRFNNLGGTIDVRIGTLEIVGSTGIIAPSHTGGHFVVAAGATLDLTTGASNARQIFDGVYTGGGEGLIRLNGGQVVVAPGGATFSFDSYQWTGGRINGGSAGLTNTGVMWLESGDDKQLIGSLRNAGTIIHSASSSDLVNHTVGVLTNLPGAIYDFQGDKTIAHDTFINRGTLRKSAGSGIAIVSPQNFSNDGGTIDVLAGTLQIAGVRSPPVVGGVSTGGVFNVATGAVLDLTYLQHTVRYAGNYTGSGGGTIRVQSGTLQVDSSGATFNFPPGMFQWTGGSIAAGLTGLTNAGSMTLAGSDIKYLSGVLNNLGTITHTAAGDLQIEAFFSAIPGTLNNLASGLYDLQGDADLTHGVFNNAGTLRKSAGTDVSMPRFGNRLNNLGGTIDVRSGTFLLQGNSSVNFTTHTGGNFIVAGGAFLDLTNMGGNQVFTGSYTGSGEGLVRMIGTNGTGAAFTVGAGGATFNFPPGLLHWRHGIIDGRVAPLLNRGSMTIIGFGDAGQRQTLLGTLNNAGTILHEGNAALWLQGISQGNLTNLAEGVYQFQGDGGSISLTSSGAQVHNFGIIRKATGAGDAFVATTLVNNTGTIEVDAGRFIIGGVGSVTLSQADGETLTGGTWIAKAGASLLINDYARFTTNRATVVLDGPGSRFPSMEQVRTNLGSLTITGGRDLPVTIGRVARNFQTPLANAYGLALDPAAGSLFVYQGALTQIYEFAASGSEALPRIPFPGSTAGAVDLDFTSRQATIGGAVVPAGTLLVINGSGQTAYAVNKDTGAVLANVPLPLPAGTILGGAYHAARNTLFVVSSSTAYEINPTTGAVMNSFPVQPVGSPTYSLSYGDLAVDDLTGNLVLASGSYDLIRELTPTGQWVRDQNVASLNLGRLGGIAIDQATRRVWVCNLLGSIYELESVFDNRGELVLGGGSTLDVPGTFIQSGEGTLTTHIGGDPASGQFGRVVASGPAALAGEMGVTLASNFGPTAGQQYPIVTFSSAAGDFTKFSGLSTSRSPLFDADKLPTSVVLSAVGSAANLAFDSFVAGTMPATATPGQVINISYDVRNISSTPATGDWVDSLYLSRDATLDENDVLLGRVEHRGGVTGMSSYRETFSGALPALAEGSYRVIVLSDSRGLVQEANRDNNIGFSTSAIAVTVPLLPLGTPASGSITSGQDRYFRLAATPGSDVKISADFSTANAAQVFLRYGQPPDQSTFDQSSDPSIQQQRLLIANPQGGSYYLLVHGRSSTSFTLRADTAGFEVIRLAPQPLRGSNQGKATLDVFGSQFTAQTTLRMLNDSGASRDAESVQFIDSNQLRATFDLTGLPTTNYRVQANDPAAPQPAFALDTFTVTDGPPGIVSLLITSPAFVRVGAPIAVDITVINGNDNPAVAPLLKVVATNVAAGQERRDAMGEGTNVLPGVLPPLYEGHVGLIYNPNPKARGVVSTFSLQMINPSAELVHWDSHKETLRPTTIPTDAWNAIWANLRPRLGNTLADLYTLLRRDAEQLALLGSTTGSPGMFTNDIDRLFKYELRKANDLPAVPVPAAAVDASFPAPGLPLVFARGYGASIADRFHVGRLGRGWTDNFDLFLTKETDADVVSIQQGHGTRVFAKSQTGAYFAMPGDFATLTEAAGVFQVREVSGEVTAFRGDGRLDYVQDTNGNRITAGYAGTQLTSLTHSNGSALTITYNTQGRISQVTDPAGRIASYEYDASGEHLTRVTTVAGSTEYAYTPEAAGPRAHAITSIAFPAGTHYFFDYDSQGRLARQERDGGAESVTLSYHGIFYRIRDALDNSTDVYFDDLGNTKQILDDLARPTRFSHTLPHSFNTASMTAEGSYSTFQYDARGNAVRMVDPLGRTQQSEYEPVLNNLVSWRDALERETGFAYDAGGNPLSTTYANGTADEFGHDAQGNLVRIVTRRGQLTRYTHDSRGLVTRKDLPDGSRVDYMHDARGNLLSATDPRGATVMEYDAADRMTKITYPGGRFLQFTYDVGGRRIRTTDHSGFSTNYRYDAAGRLAELTDGGGQRLVLYQYDPIGRLALETRGNGVKTTYEYDDAGQLLHLIHSAPDSTVLSRFDYTYDADGRRTSMTTLEGTTEYVYDAGGQLLLVALPNGRIVRYSYDAAGNRTEVTDNGATTGYTVNEMNQYLAVGSTSQSFDPDGNLVSSFGPDGARSYTYDADGQLVSAITPQGTWNYEYDVFGNRIATIHNGLRTEYLIDPGGLSSVFAEYDGSGAVRAHFAHGLGLVSRVDTAGPAAYFQYDANGNTAQLTGSGGAILNTYSYLPFGEPLSAIEAVANPFTFVGQLGVMREENGLDYMRNRWYDPTQGRFTQQDPIGLAGGANLYAYVGNSPLTFTDPTGLVDPISGGLLIEGMFVANPSGMGAVSGAFGSTGAATADAAIGQGIRAQTDALTAAFVASQTPVGASAAPAYFGNPGITQGELAIARAHLQRELGRQAAQAAWDRSPLASSATKAPGRLGIIGMAIQTGLVLFSLKRGLTELAITGDLPNCALGSNETARVFELCKGSAAQPIDLLDLVHPLAAAGVGLTSTEQREPAFDPNDLFGPAGFGADRFLADRPSLPYVIQFENIPAAEGPAAQVVVTHQLDDDLDLDTFELGDFGFGDLVVDMPDGRQYYSTRLDLRSTRGVYVDFLAQLDHSTRVVTWTLTALDPSTLDIPIDPFTGFLPPNRTKPEGEGFVNYSIRPKASSPTGARIEAQARIVFDTNDPIDTPLWVNTLDVDGPTSSVADLPASVASTRFLVRWNGEDDVGGSGIGAYDIYVSENGAPPVLWRDDTTHNEDTYFGTAGHSYAFFSVATDNVGHTESIPASADTETTVSLLEGDFNGDGLVGLADLAILQAHIDATGDLAIANGDLNGDGVVNRADLAMFATRFGQFTTLPLPKPSPAAADAVHGNPRARENAPLSPAVQRRALGVSRRSLNALRRAVAVDRALLGNDLQRVDPPQHGHFLHAIRRPRHFEFELYAEFAADERPRPGAVRAPWPARSQLTL